MTAPAYDTDLQDVDDADYDTNWAEFSGRSSGGAASEEDRAFIQGSGCISQSLSVATGRTTGLECDYGSNISWTSGWVFLFWQYFQAPKAIGTWADGGMRVGVGSAAGNCYAWNSQGNDYGRNPYGGWANVAIDPTYTADETIGSPSSGNYRYFSSLPYLLQSVSKGNPHCVDAIRYGRGEIYAEYGSSGDGYATFAGMAAANDNNSNRWGLFSYQNGSYLWKGLMSIGTDSNPCEFVDSNKAIIVDDAPRTYADFNKIEINDSDSVVSWTLISFFAQGTLAKGRLEVVDAADVTFDSCLFKGMDTFVFLSSCDILNCTFLNCGIITANGADLTGSKINGYEGTAGTSPLIWDVNTNPDGYLDDMTFTKGTAATHAIEFGTNCPSSMTLRGCDFSGYNASDGQNDSTLHIKATGGTITISCVSCAGNISYKSDGATVVIVLDPVTVKCTVTDVNGDPVENARVMLRASDDTGPFPYQETVTIVNSGTTATVTHTAHGMLSNDYVDIKGASHLQNNGIHQITKINDNSYSYVMSSAPGSSPTGTITSTFVALYGLSSALGIVTTSRVYSDDQPVAGWARKSTSAPFYKSAPISGEVDSVDGLPATAVMLPDD